jgi:CheY-like chemotaxis protein
MGEEKKRRILVADDSPAVIQIADIILKEAGYEVLIAKNGYDALNIIKTQELSLVLLDRKMPMFDGDDLLPMIKSGFKGLPVIVITGNDEKGAREECIRKGASGYLTKPLKIDQLLAAIEEVLG